jgi:hypothetical protein
VVRSKWHRPIIDAIGKRSTPVRYRMDLRRNFKSLLASHGLRLDREPEVSSQTLASAIVIVRGRVACFKVDMDRARMTLAFTTNSLRRIRLTPYISPIAAEGCDAVGRRTDWPSRERVNHPQRINQRLGNPSITRHFASKDGLLALAPHACGLVGGGRVF